MAAPIASPPWLDDSCHGLVARVREAWGWLGLLVEPGPETRRSITLTDAQRERIDAAVRDERADRAGQPARGLGPLTERHDHVGVGALASSPAAARISVVDAMARVRELVVDAARAAASALDAVYIGQRAGDGAVDDALGWLAGGRPVWVASQTSILGWHGGESILDQLHLTALRDVAALLIRADRIARAAAGVADDDTMAFPDPCPACGRRSLQWQIVGHDRRAWSVHCIRQECRCIGHGCGCRQATRYRGRRHAWPYAELSGPWGLWSAIARARRRPPRIRSEAVGHGGWADRATGRSAGGTLTIAGVVYIEQESLLARLGPDINPAMLRYWARTFGINRIHLGRQVWWPLQQVIEAEHTTRTGRGSRRREP